MKARFSQKFYYLIDKPSLLCSGCIIRDTLSNSPTIKTHRFRISCYTFDLSLLCAIHTVNKHHVNKLRFFHILLQMETFKMCLNTIACTPSHFVNVCLTYSKHFSASILTQTVKPNIVVFWHITSWCHSLAI